MEMIMFKLIFQKTPYKKKLSTWMEHLHLPHSPTMEIFYAQNKLSNSRGMSGLGIDRAMKNWEFSKTVE